MSDNKIINKQFIHSCSIRTKTGNAVIVKEKNQYEDGTIKPNLVLYENPKRSFYITQPKYRTYNYKPEYELASRLDKITVSDHELYSKVAELFNLGPGYHSADKLFKSPYIFGADINVEALIKMRYMNQYPDSSLLPTVGFLDIETSIDTNQIIMISYLHDTTVHTAILRSFFFEEKGKDRVPINLDDLVPFIQKNLEGRTKDINFTYDIKIFDIEIKLIAWIMQCIHMSETDFISIWNMNFDIPKILATIVKSGYRPEDLFHNPKLPTRCKYLKYHEDKQKKDHFTLKWHWLYSSCGTQCVDAMGLYSQCRRTQGYLDKYSLDNVLDKEIQMGKLPLISGSHVIMQRHHFKEYIVYNIFDVIGLKLLEDRINDFVSMHVLIGPTPVSKFATQTTRSTNDMYYDLINKGMILSSKSGDDPFIKFDKYLPRVGGAVLSASRVRGVGIPLTL
jgi:hypothetical protein